MRKSFLPQAGFESLNSAQINKLPPHLQKTKCIDDKNFKAKRKKEALELAEIVYDLFRAEEPRVIIKEGKTND